MLLGMTIFLLFPFSRLVHVWSGFASVAYLFRPYQLVRSRRLNLPAGHNTPRRDALRAEETAMTTTHCTAAVPASTAAPSPEPTRRSMTPPCASAPAPNCCARRPAEGLLPIDDTAPADGVISEPASHAIEHLLEQVRLQVPEPDEAACRRHHAGHQAAATARGERVRLRHILFAVTPGVDVVALRQRAEQCCSTCAATTARRCSPRAPRAVQLPQRRPGR
jgi:hypothetical protein